jgi:hypothetical protein
MFSNPSEFDVIMAELQEISDDLAESLFEAGCDDGTPRQHWGIEGGRARPASWHDTALPLLFWPEAANSPCYPWLLPFSH